MQKRYRTWNEVLREKFHGKVFKVPIDAGFDCPNRDGTVAKGGCTFCTVSGSGDMIIAPEAPLKVQFKTEVDAMHKKWPNAKQYLVYFQNFTNTHEKVEVIKERYEQVLNEDGIVGICIGTRPDCLPPETLEYLSELNKRFYLWVELGLQTTYEHTSDLINRAHSYETYVDAVKRLRQHNIHVCVHLINGLPGETPQMMLENVRRVICDSDIQSIKLHLLHLLRGTKMQKDYDEGRLKLMEKDEYVNVICNQLEIIPDSIIIQRITGDAPWDSLIGPMWSRNKWEVLNAIDEELERRNSYQGKFDCRKEMQNAKDCS